MLRRKDAYKKKKNGNEKRQQRKNKKMREVESGLEAILPKSIFPKMQPPHVRTRNRCSIS